MAAPTDQALVMVVGKISHQLLDNLLWQINMAHKKWQTDGQRDGQTYRQPDIQQTVDRKVISEKT